MQDIKTGLKVCFLPFNDVLWHLQVEELEEKLLDQTQEVERLRSELVRPCWTMLDHVPQKRMRASLFCVGTLACYSRRTHILNFNLTQNLKLV